MARRYCSRASSSSPSAAAMAPRRVMASGDSASTSSAFLAEISALRRSFFFSRSHPRSRCAVRASMLGGGAPLFLLMARRSIHIGGQATMRALLIVLLTLAAACPRKPVFDPTSTGHMPGGGHPQARERFDRARALFESNDWAGARDELEAVQRDYPDDPIAPHVALYSGM